MNTLMRNFFARLLATKDKTKQVEVSQQIFASIVQTAKDAIIIADGHSNIIFCNKKAAEVFGYSEQEMVATNLAMLLPEKYRETHKKVTDRLVAKKTSRLIEQSLEAEGVKKSGVVFPIEISFSFWQEQGAFFTAIIRDITRRKQAEQELTQNNKQLQQANEELVRIQETLKETNNELERRVEQRTQELAKSEQELRLITDALPVLISYLDKEKKYRFTNQAYEWWFGLSREAIIGKTMREIAGEEAYQAVKEKVEQALAGQSVYFEKQMNYQRVESRYVAFHLIPRFEEKNVVGFYLLATDISSRIKAEQEARVASGRLSLLLESIPHLAWTSPTDDLSINFFNKRWYEYTGLTQQQSLGLGWQQVLHPDDLAIVIERRRKGRSEGLPYAVENRYRHHDGSYRWHLARVVPVIDESGKISLWLGTATDIHEQKLLQQTLQTTTQELAASNEKLRSITEELQATNEELVEANRGVLESNHKLEASNEQLTIINTDLDNFIYTASHDLKSPIANIEGLTIALVKKLTHQFLLDDEQNKILSMIAASVDRLKSTIGNLTEIAKVQKESEEEEMVSIEKVVEEVVQDLGKLIADTGVTIHKQLEVSEIKFAQKNLRSIIFNLLSNAIKYHSQERKPEVYISTKKVNDFIRIQVQDNGIGIAENNVLKLFTMFKRFHTHVEGTGIGLYIMKRIVENAGGKIEVESKVNRGTIFIINLPIN